MRCADAWSSGARFAFGTDRLLIQPLTEVDEALYCGLYTDAETMRFIGPALTWEQAARSFRSALRLNRRQPMKHVYLKLVQKTDLQSIGICSLQGIDASKRLAEAGIIIAPGSRASGLAKEALGALVTRTFEVLPIDDVWMQTEDGHVIVERMAVSVGFESRSAIGPTRGRVGRRLWFACRQSWSGVPISG